jgi:HlyD family secretion protein
MDTKNHRGRLKKKSLVLVTVAPVVAVLVLYLGFLRADDGGTEYEVAEITRGNIENMVTCTGTLSAVGTVEIGTQVSGTLDEILVDFNDRVDEGAILAVLDTTLLKAAVMDAEAGLLSAQAQYAEAYAEYERNLPLFERGYVSEQEFVPIQSGVKTREAQVQSAMAALDRAQANLMYAVIRSPIEGTVIQRNVEPGQTVAASLSTPTLFLIAEDLSEMEILVDVDESDIGQVEEGQEARFTVQTYPDETFSGVVEQIRLQPEVIQNVVTYTVVVSASNPEGTLLPGMTATVDLLVENLEDVVLVPNSALKLSPTEEMTAKMLERMKMRRGALPDSTRQSIGAEMAGIGGRGGFPSMTSGDAQAGQNDVKMIWLLDENGDAMPRPVRIGATDGKMSEVIGGRGIEEGVQIIVGVSLSEDGDNDGGTAARGPGGPPGFKIF